MTLADALTVVLAIGVCAVLGSLIFRHRQAGSAINLDDLLLGADGRVSKSAVVMFGSFALSTWVIAYLTLTGQLGEGYFTAYLGAWVAPTVAAMFKPKGTHEREDEKEKPPASS